MRESGSGVAVRSHSRLTRNRLIPSADTDPPQSDVESGVAEIDPELDDEVLDAKWGVESHEALVGHGAPPVVAVLVTSDPGDWFEESIESLADSDYENLVVLVLDNAGKDDPTGRIAEVLPSAFVKRLEADAGFSSAANEVLEAVDGAAFYLVIHDDVRLSANAVTELVAEAFRSNAGIVGPKLLKWDDPRELSSVGIAVDPYGFSSSIAEPGELDQSQHDTAREVFAVSDACMLVRADLFHILGGFNVDIPYFGEDIDLCWRAHAAGATVRICPSATALHRGEFQARREVGNRQRLELRHEARTMLTNYEPLRLLWVVPLAFLLSVTDLLGSLILGRFQRAGDIAGAWVWNLAHLPALMRSRSRAKKTRRARDREYLDLMRQGSSRLRSLIRGGDGENRLQNLAEAGKGYLRDAASRSRRVGIAIVVVSVALMVFGARNLFFGNIPVMREFAGVVSGGRMLSEWFSGWRDVGLGEPAVAPSVIPALGAVGTLLLGSVQLARRFLILLPLVVGVAGAWKLLADRGSTVSRAVAMAAYGLNPVVLGALAGGRLQALVVYAAAPWFIRRVARAAGVEPFTTDASLPVSAGRAAFVQVTAGSALILAAVGSVSPLGLVMLVDTTLILGVVLTLTSDRRGGLRMIVRTITPAVVALLVLAPWLVASLRSGDLASLSGMWKTSAAAPSAAEIITGGVGKLNVGVLGWGLPIAAAFSLVVARRWRFSWAMAGWLTALAYWLIAVLVARAGAFAGGGLELLLIPAVVGMTLSLAMGVVAFEEDVLGSDFGLQQLLSGVAVAAFVVGLVPVAVASTDGRWYLPQDDFLASLAPVDKGEAFRTLWIGDPDVLPAAGWDLKGEGLSFAVTSGFKSELSQRFRLDGGTGVAALRTALNATIDGQTTRLGRLLAPMGIGYVVVVDRPVPVPYSHQVAPMPADILAGLRQQIDLRSIDVNPAAVMFGVEDPWPLRSDVSELVDQLGRQQSASEQVHTSLSAPSSVLGTGPGNAFSGKVEPKSVVAQAVTADPGWKLRVDGADALRSDLFEWSQSFRTTRGGEAQLRWHTPASSRLLQLLQLGSLLALVVLAFTNRRGRLVLAAVSGRGGGRRGQMLTVGPEGLISSTEDSVAASSGKDNP